MRELKFRVWDTTRKKFIIDFVLSPDGYVMCEGSPHLYYEGMHETKIELIQYTGLKDKNGKEIYEGDILCCPHYPANGSWHYLYHKVMWDEKLAIWKTVSIGNKEGEEITAHGNPPLWVYIKAEKEFEIIGNIYENPELLNAEQNAQESDTTEAK